MEKREGVLYFAYGATMDERKLLEGLKLTYLRKFPARKKNWGLNFNTVSKNSKEYGLSNINPDSSTSVYGIAYLIPTPKMLPLIDAVEGQDYQRELKPLPIEILDPSFEKVARTALAEVYIARAIKSGLQPTREHLQLLLAGKDFLPPSYFSQLEGTDTID